MSDRFYAFQCQNCDELHYPRHFLCRRCGGDLFNPVLINGECELLTWTRLYSLPEGFQQPCLTFGMVQYPNGLRVTGHLQVKNPRIGMSLNTTVGPIRQRGSRIEQGLIFIDKTG
ncbi:MAG: Zn-ribbon domain-containing OB-fold protein [Bacillota bacterium]